MGLKTVAERAIEQLNEVVAEINQAEWDELSETCKCLSFAGDKLEALARLFRAEVRWAEEELITEQRKKRAEEAVVSDEQSKARHEILRKNELHNALEQQTEDILKANLPT